MAATKRHLPPSPSPTIQFTSRSPQQWAYFKLALISQSPSNPSSPLDLLTARTYLTSALSQHLGLVGTSIPVDFLKLDLDHDHHQRNRDYIWIRVPRDDATALATALSSWVGNSEKESEAVAFRVLERGTFLGGMMGGDGRELFA